MPITLRIAISGNVKSALEGLGPGEIERRLRPALREATTFAQMAIVSKTPVRTGRLAGSIGVRVVGNVGTVKTSLHYGLFVEEGTRPHLIAAKRARVLAANGRVFGKTVNHPGTTGRRMFGRTYEQDADKIVAIFERHFTR